MFSVKTIGAAVLGAAAIGLSVGSVAPAVAAVLVDNGAPDLANGVFSDFASQIERGDNFSLSSDANITKINWSGGYANSNTPLTDSFSVRLFNIVGGTPNTSPFATLSGSLSRVDSGLNINLPNAQFFDVYNYALTLTTPFSIAAGNYLLSIVNNTTNDPDNNWFWATSAQTRNSQFRSNPGDAWSGSGQELSFSIEDDTTPIPTPALLPGLLGMGIAAWRKRKNEESEQVAETVEV